MDSLFRFPMRTAFCVEEEGKARANEGERGAKKKKIFHGTREQEQD